MHKITHNSMKNRCSTQILTKLVLVNPRNIHKQFDAHSYSDLREVEKVKSSQWQQQQQRQTQGDRFSYSLIDWDC